MRDRSSNDLRVSSWTELNERLYESAWRPHMRRFRSNYVYRGMIDARFDLQTSLQRLGGAYPDHERRLLRHFRKYAMRAAVSWPDSTWNWLAVAQHHGLPTRLLDWTYSPFVALHFATSDLRASPVDAAIWCIDFEQTNRLLPPRLKELLADDDSNVFTVEMLGQVSATFEEFDALSEDSFVAFFEPPSLDDRIVNQFALFSLMSGADTRLDHWLARHPEVYRRIIVPAELKWEVRDKLDEANVTERVLFPGLDGLSQWLRRYYSPGPYPATGSAPPSAGRPDTRRAESARGSC